jgi:DNA-binding Xre family transcriptional regulator
MIRLKVKEVAREKQISQTRLGRLADIDSGTIRKIFSGEANITLELLNRLARTLRVHPAELLDYVPDPPPEY